MSLTCVPVYPLIYSDVMGPHNTVQSVLLTPLTLWPLSFAILYSFFLMSLIITVCVKRSNAQTFPSGVHFAVLLSNLLFWGIAVSGMQSNQRDSDITKILRLASDFVESHTSLSWFWMTVALSTFIFCIYLLRLCMCRKIPGRCECGYPLMVGSCPECGPSETKGGWHKAGGTT